MALNSDYAFDLLPGIKPNTANSMGLHTPGKINAHKTCASKLHMFGRCQIWNLYYNIYCAIGIIVLYSTHIYNTSVASTIVDISLQYAT